MKRHLKRYTSLTHYIEFLRKQPKHAQHIYAAIFAGSITFLIAFFILYTDYGFWHERYVKEDLVVASSTLEEDVPESPSTMFSRFLGEAGGKLKDIKNISPKEMIEGRETYVR